MKTLAIIASNPGFGGSANLNEAFTLCSQEYRPVLITANDAPYGFGDEAKGERIKIRAVKDRPVVIEIMEDPETYFFIVDLSGLVVFSLYWFMKYLKPMKCPYELVMGEHEAETQFMIDNLRKRNIIFFWTGTQYLRNHETVNKWVKEIGVRRTYAMPDLMRCDYGALPLLQPYEFRNTEQKYAKFTVCHSPGAKDDSKEKLGKYWNEKGTEEIRRVFEELKPCGIDSFILGGVNTVNYRTAISVKSKCHLFVDKLSDHSAGLGKSGLEAMALGIPTLCSMQHTNLRGTRYDDIPVINIQTEEELKDAILVLKNEPAKYEYFQICSKKWAEKINYRNTVDYLEGTMEW